VLRRKAARLRSSGKNGATGTRWPKAGAQSHQIAARKQTFVGRGKLIFVFPADQAEPQSMVMTRDDGVRDNVGVVVTLRDIGGGKSRITLDDVRSGSTRRENQWSFDVFYTHKDLDTVALDGMQLADKEYEGLGVAILARLLALTGRAKWPELDVDDDLSPEEEARAAMLTNAEIARIDAALISNACTEWRKLAMVVALAMSDCEAEIPGLSDVFYSRRAAHLVSNGSLTVEGSLRKMRYCQVKLPDSGHPSATD
jgi:hypothetical protein